LTADSTPIGTAISAARMNAVSPSSMVAGRYEVTTCMAGCRKWMDRPKSPSKTLRTKTRYCTGSDRSRPSSARTRKISLRGASGGSRSGTGSPDSRMTTNTTVDTSQSATSARRSRLPRKVRSARID
jgi:hypothetical protein